MRGEAPEGGWYGQGLHLRVHQGVLRYGLLLRN
jgi:hypothetical protein